MKALFVTGLLLLGGTVSALAQGGIPTPVSGASLFGGSNDLIPDGVARLRDSLSRLGPSMDPLSARDGCEDIPGVAHNSADCSRIISWDPSWTLPDKPIHQMTGAERNMLRNYRILVGDPAKAVAAK